jgi:hypothetical protein
MCVFGVGAAKRYPRRSTADEACQC